MKTLFCAAMIVGASAFAGFGAVRLAEARMEKAEKQAAERSASAGAKESKAETRGAVEGSKDRGGHLLR